MDIRFAHVLPNPLKEIVEEESLFNKDFTFTAAGKYQLIAPSGKGKSTVVGLITGNRGDYTGELYIGPKLSTSFSPTDWSNWRISGCSAVYQDLQLFPSLTAVENIQICNEIGNYRSSGEYNSGIFSTSLDQVHAWAKILGVTSLLNRKLGTLSFGQMQRIAIVRALNRDFRWLVLDEPFSHLDEENVGLAVELLISEANRRNSGIIITSLDKRNLISGFEMVTV